MKRTLTPLAVIAAVAIATLAGCAQPAVNGPATAAPVITDAWVRAIPDVSVDGDMTGMFMTVENTSDEDVYLIGGTTDGTYTDVDLDAHEVVADANGEMVMQPAEGGILIPAHGTTQLMPGGYHVMFWKLKGPIAVGDDVHATINFSNGTSVDVHATAMTVEMGQEKYVGDTAGMNQ